MAILRLVVLLAAVITQRALGVLLASIESGHKLFHLKNGEAKYWYYTTSVFGSLRCIDSLAIDSMDPLTGAEEIQILYTECEADDQWSLVHYHNRGSQFSLIRPILASKIAVVYATNLPVVDVSFGNCHDTRPYIPPADCGDKETKPKDTPHKLRHHRKKQQQATKISQRDLFGHLRSKREALGGELSQNVQLLKDSSPYEVTSDLTVPEGITLTLEPGVELRFRSNLKLDAKGRLVAKGTKEEPIQLVPLADGLNWSGLNLVEDYILLDVRLSQSQQGNDGIVEVFDADLQRWRLICTDGWSDRAENVVCRQLGYKLGAVTDAESFDYGGHSNDFWLSTVTCIGTEQNIQECARSQTVSCQTPPATARCQGASTLETSKPSVLEHVNCSGTVHGIQIVGRLPRLSHVTSDNSKGHGMNIITFFDSTHVYDPLIHKVQLSNNRLSGLRLEIDYPSKTADQVSNAPKFTISDCILASNREDGLTLRGRGQIDIERSSFFGNAQDGLNSLLSDGKIQIDDVLSASNSRYSLQFFRDDATLPLEISMTNCNITGHWWGSAILVNTGHKTTFLLQRCQLWQNYNGAILFGALSESNIKILDSNFTRNRGRILWLSEVRQNTAVTIDRNLISLNLLSNYSARQSVISITMAPGEQSNTDIRLSNNKVIKNTMENALQFKDNRLSPATKYSFLMEHNVFQDNLAPDIVMIDALHADLAENTFSNPGSICELRLGLFRPLAQISAANNYWAKTEHNEVAGRICDFSKDSSLMSANYLPFMLNDQMTRPGTVPPVDTTEDHLGGIIEKDNLVLTATNGPYRVMQSLLISPHSTLTIEEGARLIFEEGRGLRVKGTLVIQGTQEKPVTMIGDGQKSWNGIVFDNEESSSDSILRHCVIENALEAITLYSSRVKLSNCVISKPASTGIKITESTGLVHEFGDSTILRSQGRGLWVSPRSSPIELRNLKIMDSHTIGIDFEQPTGDITINNVEVSNSGEFGIKIDQAKYGMLSIKIEGLQLTNQVRGKAGLLINARDYKQITISNSIFSQNSVPSVDLALRCKYTENDPSYLTPEFQLKHSRFVENLNVVAAISLLYCVRANISRNEFINNNRDFRFGALKVVMEPSQNVDHFKLVMKANLFSQNQGEYTVYLLPLTMYHFDGEFTGNQLKDNQNRRSALILGSPLFVPRFNHFDNPYSTYDLEVEYNDDKVLDASQNSWGTNKEPEVQRRILDGNIIVTRGLVKFKPFLIQNGTEPTSSCEKLNHCNGHGACLGDNVCQCENGYGGLSCAVYTCADYANCNSNGICNGPNSCHCFTGWSGLDCSVPSCNQLNQCNNHGRCVSLNECRCFQGWAGSDCSSPECESNCHSHGVCVDVNNCQCYPGWLPPHCERADCAAVKDCSSRGVCVAPNTCQCMPEFTGTDCSVCKLNNCEHLKCDFQCVYGLCDPVTGSCVCDYPWSGAACDVCTVEDQCTMTPRLDYILPQAVALPATKELQIFAHGKNFELPTNNEYECVFGSQSSVGQWITNQLISCPPPEGATIGKHKFDLHPENKEKTAVASPQTHYITFYQACQADSCTGHGVCMQGNCICSTGFSGDSCQQQVAAPKIQITSLPTSAQEGQPLQFQLKTEQTDSGIPVTWTKISGPEGVDVSQSGMVTWSEVIGSSEPINIRVALLSIHGKDEITWSLNVPVTYKPEIETIIQEGNSITVKGKVTGANAAAEELPVKLKLYKNGVLLREVLTTSRNGVFEHKIASQPDEAGQIRVVAVHPGDESGSGTPIGHHIWALSGMTVVAQNDVIQFESDQIVEILVDIQNIGATTLSGFDVQLIDDVSLSLQSVTFTDQYGTRGANSELLSGDKMTASVAIKPLNGPNEQKILIRVNTLQLARTVGVTLVRTFKGVKIVSQPESINISSSVAIPNENVELVISNLGDTVSPKLDVQFEPESPLFLVSFGDAKTPALQPGQTTTLTLGILPKNVPLRGNMHGEFKLIDMHSVSLLSVAYDIHMKPEELLDIQVYIQDEDTYSKSERPLVTEAEARLVNPQDGFSDTQYSKSSIEPIMFKSISEGMYELEISAPKHEPFSTPIHVTRTQLVQTVFVEQKVVEYKPILAQNGTLSLATDFQVESSLPLLVFKPESLTLDLEAEILPQLETRITVENSGNTAAMFSGAEIETKELPFLFSVRSISASVEPGQSWTIPVTIIPNAEFDWTKSKLCDGYLLPLKYSYTLGDRTFVREAQLMVAKKSADAHNAELCKVEQKPDGMVSVWPVSLHVHTNLWCVCESGARQTCVDGWSSPKACGPILNAIQTQQAGLSTIVWAARLINTCRIMNIHLGHTERAVSCLSSLNEVCPGTAATQQLQSLIEFKDMFVAIKRMLDINELRLSKQDASWFDDFLHASSDLSPFGALITENEEQTITNKARDVADFIRYWNSTVSNWTTGRATPDSTNQFASFAHVTDAHNRTLGINQQAQQAAFDNGFDQLESYFSSQSVSDLCASALLSVTPNNPIENGQFNVKLQLTNQLSLTALQSVIVSLAFQSEVEGSNPIEFNIDIPRLDGIITLNGLNTIQPQQTVSVEWKVLSKAVERLTRPTSYSVNVDLSFFAQSQTSNYRLFSQKIVFRPSPALKVFYFLSPTIGPARPAPFSAMAAVMNAGYSTFNDVHLTDTRLKLVAISEQTRMVHYRLEAVTVDSSPKITTFSQNLTSIPKGQSAHVAYNLSTDETASLRQFSFTPMVDGAITPLTDERSFSVVRLVNDKLLITERHDSHMPQYAYDMHNSQLNEITSMDFVRATTESFSVGSEPWRNVTATFKPSAFVGQQLYGYGRFELDFELNQQLQLISVKRIQPAPVTLSTDDVWIIRENGREVVHLADEELNLAADGSPSVNYEFIFGKPDSQTPTFTKSDYEVTIPVAAIPNSNFLRISAKYWDGNTKINYKLYGGDGLFSIDKYKGEVKLIGQLPGVKSRYCLTVVAAPEGVPEQRTTTSLVVIISGARDPVPSTKCDTETDLENKQGYSHDGDKLLFTTTGGPDQSTKPNTQTTQTVTTGKITQSTPTTSTASTSSSKAEQSTTVASTTNPSTTEQTPETTSAPTTSSVNTNSPSTVITSASTSTTSPHTQSPSPTVSSSTAQTETPPSSSSEASTSTSTTPQQSTSPTASTSPSASTSSSASTAATSGSTTTIDSGNIDPTPSTVAPTDSVETTKATTRGADRSTTTDPDYIDINEIDEKKLKEMACRLRETKPIWGVICDLSKTVP